MTTEKQNPFRGASPRLPYPEAVLSAGIRPAVLLRAGAFASLRRVDLDTSIQLRKGNTCFNTS